MQVLRRMAVSLWLVCCSMGVWATDIVTERSWVEDPSGNMTLAEVVAAEQKPWTGTYFGQGFSASAFWIRLRIDPAQWPGASPEQELVVRLRPVYLDEIRLHDPLAPGGEVRYTGDRHPWTEDDYQSLNNNFVVPLGAAPRDIWLRLKTTTSTLSAIEVLDLKTARANDMRQVVRSLIYISILLICLGWGVLSWLTSRDQLVRLYVFREFFMIAYALIILGVWRVLGSEIVSSEWIDWISNLGFFMVGVVGIWFDIHFLKKFKPRNELIKALYVLLFVFISGLILRAAADVGWALRIYAIGVLLASVTVFLTAASTRVWSETSDQPRLVISKKVLIGYYLFLALINVANRLIAMNIFPGVFDVWDIFLVYPMAGSLMMMAMLQLRAQQQHKLQQQAEWRIALAERSAQEEKSKRQEQQQFLAMLGHELRNPLSAVNFLADAKTPEGQQIRRAVQDMSLVLERSVQAEQLEEGGFQPHVHPVHLRDLLKELGRRAPPERLQLQMQALPEHILTDKLLLSIVLANLVDNALKYSPESSVVRFQTQWLPQQLPTALRFRIANVAGPSGVPDKEKIFQKYYRSPAAHHQVGSGLGLYLVSGLLKVLGGHIECVSCPSDGVQQVVFEVTLPVQLAPVP